jgi:molybdate transport system substrate-binding protein
VRLSPRLDLIVLVLCTATVAACGTDDTAPQARTVTVFAAASLTDAFTDLGDAFEQTFPNVDVVLNFAASSDLVTQIGQGAPVDVFASADEANMTRLTDTGGMAGRPSVFATNRAAILVEAGNPQDITGIADLADPDLIVVVCSPEVPCGRYAQQVFDNAGVAVVPRSFEENVKAVVSKVTLGEADAGIVYVTDVIAAGDRAQGVEIAPDVNVVARYPIAVTAQAADPPGAQAFIDFVVSDAGRAVLASYGFGPP